MTQTLSTALCSTLSLFLLHWFSMDFCAVMHLVGRNLRLSLVAMFFLVLRSVFVIVLLVILLSVFAFVNFSFFPEFYLQSTKTKTFTFLWYFMFSL